MVGTDCASESRGIAKDTNIRIIIVRMYLFVPTPGVALRMANLRQKLFASLSLCYGMDFRDVPSRKLHEHGFSFIGFIRRHQHFDAGCLSLGERVR